MSDDIREREPARDLADNPEEEGLRSDNAGTSATLVSPAPPTVSGGQSPTDRPEWNPGPDRPDGIPLADRPDEFPLREDPDEPTSQLTSAGGGYGSGSARASSGGSGDAQSLAGDDAQTNWLRKED